MAADAFSTQLNNKVSSVKAGPLAYAGQDPSLPAYSLAPGESEAHLTGALEPLRNAMQGYGEMYRTESARAGLDPSSGVSQQMLRDMMRNAGAQEAGVRRDYFLDTEQSRRSREEMLAKMKNDLEQTRVGSAANVQSSEIGAGASRYAANAAAGASRYAAGLDNNYRMGMLNLDQQKLPFELYNMVANPYSVSNPQYSMGQGNPNTVDKIAGGIGGGLSAYKSLGGKGF